MTTENQQDFDGKVAVVTGSGNGIGLGIARSFAAKNATVVIAEINEKSGRQAVEEIKKSGGNAIFVQVDVADEPMVERLVNRVVKELGHIDILVNNAGVVSHRSIVDLSREEWDRQLAVQLTGPFLVSKHVARHMISRGGPGKIVNISSVSAVMGRVKGGAHCASKGGLTMLTKVLAMELGEYHINVNAVAPGLIDVPSQRDEDVLSSEYQNRYMQEVPLKRMGTPADISNMVTFLSSDDADWITGQLFLVDGGLMSGHLSFQGVHDYSMLFGH